MMESQNNAKALEVRLERNNDRFDVVLAGLTYNLNTGCAGGVCGDQDTYMFVDNEVYMCKTLNNYKEAIQTYDYFRKHYLNDPV